MLTISLAHATYQSMVPLRDLVEYWKSQTQYIQRVEYCLAFSADDTVTRNYLKQEEAFFRNQSRLFLDFNIIETPESNEVSAVQNWNQAAIKSQGDLLLVISDDVVPEKNWDTKLDAFLDFTSIQNEVIWKIQDSKCQAHDGDGLLPRHPLATRKFVISKDGIFNSSFLGRGADDFLLYQTLKAAQLKELEFFKLHHAFGRILNEENELNCGCNDSAKSFSQNSVSQLRISETKSDAQKKISQKTNIYFRVYGPMLCNGKYAWRVTYLDSAGFVRLRSWPIVLFHRLMFTFTQKLLRQM